MSTSRQSLVPESTGRNSKPKEDTVQRDYNPVKHARSLRWGSRLVQAVSIALLGAVVLTLPVSSGQGNEMMVFASVLNHAGLSVGIFGAFQYYLLQAELHSATCQGSTCSTRMSEKGKASRRSDCRADSLDPDGGTTTGDLISIGPLRWGISQVYLCAFYLGVISLLGPFLPTVLGLPKLLWRAISHSRRESKETFQTLRTRMRALHRQLIMTYTVLTGVLWIALAAIVRPGLGAEGSSLGTGVYGACLRRMVFSGLNPPQVLILSHVLSIASATLLKLTENEFVEKVKRAWKAKGNVWSLTWWATVVAWPFVTLWKVSTTPFRACWKRFSV